MQRGVPGYRPLLWYIGHISQTPEIPYCYYKLVTNVIRAIKIHVLAYPWYTVGYTTAVSQSAFRDRTTRFIISKYAYFQYDRLRLELVPWRFAFVKDVTLHA